MGLVFLCRYGPSDSYRDHMTFDQHRERIESVEFIARLGAVSTLYAFDRALGRLQETKDLFADMRSPAVAREVRERVVQLLAAAAKDGSAAYWLDLPVAAYMRLLDIVSDSHLPLLKASAVGGAGMWWTERVAKRIGVSPAMPSSENEVNLVAGPRDLDVRANATANHTTFRRSEVGPNTDSKGEPNVHIMAGAAGNSLQIFKAAASVGLKRSAGAQP